MRIDPNQFLSNLQSDNVQQTSSRGTQSSQSDQTGENGELNIDDQFQPSPTLDQIQQLKAQLAQVPEVRSDRVSALRQQVEQGNYKPTNQQIANAMVSELGSNRQS